MAYTCKILLGRITKASGYEGAVTVKLERSFIGKIPEMESVFLEIDGRPVPFFITGLEYPGDDSLRISFRYYESADSVIAFKGCRVFLTSGEENSDTDESLAELAGYTVYDEKNNVAGVIEKVIQNPGQVLLSIKSPAGREILVPLHEDLVVKFDRAERKLVIKIPEGLTEINT